MIALVLVLALLGGGQEKVEVCHKGRSITVAAPAVDAHVRNHGDTLGPCVEPPPSVEPPAEEPEPVEEPGPIVGPGPVVSPEPIVVVPVPEAIVVPKPAPVYVHAPSPTIHICHEWSIFDVYCD